MAIQCRLYGEFRELVSKRDSESGVVGVLELDEELCDVENLLGWLGLTEKEVSHIIVNGQYSGLDKALDDGDRVALFPKELSLLYNWYFQ